MEKVLDYIRSHRDAFVEELFEVLRIPSISAQTEHRGDMVRCAEHLAAALVKAGADHAEVMPTEGNPVVFAEKIVDPKAKTVLVYGHYDVMPVDPREEWTTEPFEPVVRDGRIWGRGADDDKGQSFMHIKAFEAMCATGQLPCNVKFMLEGEEEIGSQSLYKFCREQKRLLKSDVILVSDTSMISMDTPSITCGLRGLTYMQVEVTGPDQGFAFWTFRRCGGQSSQRAGAAGRFAGRRRGARDDSRILRRRARTVGRRTACAQQGAVPSGRLQAVAAHRRRGGRSGLYDHGAYGVRPSLDVNGIWGGYIEEGTKTIIPARASAKISMRLVPNQDFRKIAKLFERYFRAIAPRSVKVDVRFLHGGAPYVSPTDLPAYKAAEKAVEATFGKKPLPFYSGGSIPIVSAFEEILGVKSILLGFGLSRDAIHSPNESFGLDQFQRGIETIPYFYRYFAEM